MVSTVMIHHVNVTESFAMVLPGSEMLVATTV